MGVSFICETRKYLWNYLLFSEIYRDSTKKKWRKVWNITGNCLSLQRERWNQVEPRCAERWHGCGDAEMMSNSTLPLGFLHLNIELTTRGQLFYILLYLGSVNSAGSLILVAVIKFTNLTTSRFTFI